MSELYVCRWNDAHGSSGTIATHEIEHKPYEYTTVGFLVRTDEVGVSIAFEQGEDGRWRDVTFIPRLMVIEEYSIGDHERRKPRATRRKKPQTEKTESDTQLTRLDSCSKCGKFLNHGHDCYVSQT